MITNPNASGMGSAAPAHAPSLSEKDRSVVQPWFDQSGLDIASPEWRAVWRALVSAGFAARQELLLWPTTAEDYVSDETRAAQTVKIAVTAGALYAKLDQGSRWPTVVPMGPGLGVEIILALFHKYPALVAQALAAPPEHRVDTVLAAASAQAVGVFPDARAALAALLANPPVDHRRSDETVPLGTSAVEDLVLTEATRDDVFAEHVIMRLAETHVDGLDYVLLPSATWFIMRAGSDPSSG